MGGDLGHGRGPARRKVVPVKIGVGSIEVSPRKMAALSRQLGREATRLDMRARLIAAMHDSLDELLDADVSAALEASTVKGGAR